MLKLRTPHRVIFIKTTNEGRTSQRRLNKHVPIYWNTSFDVLTIETSWERGKDLQITLGIKRPASEQGTNILKAKYGWANLYFIHYVNRREELKKYNKVFDYYTLDIDFYSMEKYKWLEIPQW